jgi:hypothetical protein
LNTLVCQLHFFAFQIQCSEEFTMAVRNTEVGGEILKISGSSLLLSRSLMMNVLCHYVCLPVQSYFSFVTVSSEPNEYMYHSFKNLVHYL